MNELLDHWIFIEPDNYIDILGHSEELPKEWMQIFYIGRCLFANQTSYPIKSQMAKILERKEIFQKENDLRKINENDELIRFNLSDSVDIGRISSLQQISCILPREFVINTEEIFYKKLNNRELYKKEFVDFEGLSVSDLVYGKEKELNKRQKIFILFDNSSSMNGDKLNKLFAAKAICLEYLKRVQKEEPQIYFRYFHQELGPLLKINKLSQIKNLIRYIMELQTYDCYETKISDALMKAINDIKGDPELKQAEILMITDGLGEVPPDIKERLGKIKLHMILISDLHTDKFLKIFPNKETWEKEGRKLYDKFNTNREKALQQLFSQFGAKDIMTFREIFSKLPQIYRLQEVSDVFIKIDSFFGERFKFSNPYELDMLKDLRVKLKSKLDSNPPGKEKYNIFQRIKFILRYLEMLLTKEPSMEMKNKIKNEIKAFKILLRGFKEDEWFVSALDISNSIKKTRISRKKDKRLKYIRKNSKMPWIVALFLYLFQNLSTLHKKILNISYNIINNIWLYLIKSYRKNKLKKKIDYIDNKMFQILNN